MKKKKNKVIHIIAGKGTASNLFTYENIKTQKTLCGVGIQKIPKVHELWWNEGTLCPECFRLRTHLPIKMQGHFVEIV